MPVNSYQYLNLYQAQLELGTRLYDSTWQFWSQAELTLYIREALQTWNALTNYWRGDWTFNSGAPYNIWYNLTQQPNSNRPYTVTYTTLYNLMQYHLLEAVAWDPWTGVSNQFSANDLMNAVQRRRDEILSVTGCTGTLHYLSATLGRVLVPDVVLDIRRLAYLPTLTSGGGGGGGGPYGLGQYGIGPYGIGSGVTTSLPNVFPVALFEEDAWGEQSFEPNYLQNPAGFPSTYIETTQPQLSFDVDVPPAYGGQYELITVDAGPTLSVGTVGPSTIPDDWTHLIKWGALADLLSRESNAKDSLRAEYCNQRYQMGLKLLSGASALLAMRINNVPLQIDSVRDADLFNPGWQGSFLGSGFGACHVGLNLVAIANLNPNTTYSFGVTSVQNAPLPLNLSDFIQLGRDEMEAVLSYAQHLAAFKMGGEEFLATMPLLKKFIDQAAVYGLKLKEIAEYTTILYGLSQRQEAVRPRLQEAD